MLPLIVYRMANVGRLTEVVLPDLRKQRSLTGHQRMSWLLADLYELEPRLSRTLFDNLIQ